MSGEQAVRTPLHGGVALALGQRRYRKEILVKGPLHVGGEVFNVSDDYLNEIKAAFDAGAIKSPPVQLAPGDNSHSEDLSRRRGTVVALHRTARGLDADVELNDEAATMIDQWPDTGVSVLVKHNRVTGEGAQHPAALAHLLLTADPVITTLSPWSDAIAASHDGPTLDLLALSAPDGQGEDTTSTTKDDPNTSEEDDMPSIDDLLSDPETVAKLRQSLGLPDAPTDDARSTQDAEKVEDDEVTDDEIAEALAAVDDEPDEDTEDVDETATEDVPEPVAAGHTGTDDTLALANAQMSEQLNAQGLELSQMRQRLNEADWAERQSAYAKLGVPAALVAKAKPALHGNDTSLSLSQGDRDKTAQLVDGLLVETGKLLKALGLSQGTVGTAIDTPADKAEAEQRSSAVSGVLTAAGMTPARRS